MIYFFSYKTILKATREELTSGHGSLEHPPVETMEASKALQNAVIDYVAKMHDPTGEHNFKDEIAVHLLALNRL